MLQNRTRRRIKQHKWSKHSNKSEFIKRVAKTCNESFEEQAMIANEFEDAQLKKFFKADKIDKCIDSILRSKLNPEEKFTISYALLNNLLEHTEKLIENKLLKEQYKENKIQLKKIINSIYDGRITGTGKQQSLT